MRGSKAWVQSKDLVELSEQILTQCDKLLVRGQWHKDLLLKVSWHLGTADLQGFYGKVTDRKAIPINSEQKLSLLLQPNALPEIEFPDG
jgi:hypothetical protein